MKQVFRIVDPGRVDRMIGFEELPERMVKGLKRGAIDGLPRHWKDYLEVSKTDKDPRPFYILEYKTINADKERWQEIGNYVRATTAKEVRLLDRLEDMALPMAPDSYSAMTLEPEDILIIPVPLETQKLKIVEEAKTEEPNEPTALKKRGRPKKVLEPV